MRQANCCDWGRLRQVVVVRGVCLFFASVHSVTGRQAIYESLCMAGKSGFGTNESFFQLCEAEGEIQTHAGL